MEEQKTNSKPTLKIMFSIDRPETSTESDFNTLILKICELKDSIFSNTYPELIEYENKNRNLLIGQIQDLLNNFIIRDIRRGE